MKLQATTLSALLALQSAHGFAPSSRQAPIQRTGAPSSSTQLYISSFGGRTQVFGFDDLPIRRRRNQNTPVDPETNIRSFLPPPPEGSDIAALLRPTVGGTVIVSGFENDVPQRGTDRRLFELLNELSPVNDAGQETYLPSFDSIVAVVHDPIKAKKSMLSRSARYSGLFNKLQFVETGDAGGFGDASSWIVRVTNSEELATVSTALATAPDSLRNVVVFLELPEQQSFYADSNQASAPNGSYLETLSVSGSEPTAAASSPMPMQDEIANLISSQSGPSVTVLRFETGLDSSVAEGSVPYAVRDAFAPPYVPPVHEPTPAELEAASAAKGEEADEVTPPPVPGPHSRDEAYRLTVSSLLLRSTASTALTFAPAPDATSSPHKLLKGLRECGYDWTTELSHLLDSGVAKYDEAVTKFRTTRGVRAIKTVEDSRWAEFAKAQEMEQAMRNGISKEQETEAAEPAFSELDEANRWM